MGTDSLVRSFIRAVAERVERRMGVPDTHRPALRAAVETEIRAWLPILSGERVYLDGLERVLVRRRLTQEQAEERRARILQALDAGDTVRMVATRERVTERWVRRVRATSSVA